MHCQRAYCKSIVVSVNNARICHLLQFVCKETDKAIIDRSVGSLDIYLLEDKPGQSVLLDPFLTFSLKCQLQTFLWCQEGKRWRFERLVILKHIRVNRNNKRKTNITTLEPVKNFQPQLLEITNGEWGGITEEFPGIWGSFLAHFRRQSHQMCMNHLIWVCLVHLLKFVPPA